MTAEELERVLLHKEGESTRDAALQARSPIGMGGSGKRAIGKAVAKGGLLLKGKNPQNVCILFVATPLMLNCIVGSFRYSARKMTFDRGCLRHQMRIARTSLILKPFGKNTLISSYLEYCAYVTSIQLYRDYCTDVCFPVRLYNNVRMISTWEHNII